MMTLQNGNDHYRGDKADVDQPRSSENPLPPATMNLAVLLACAATRAAVVRVKPVAHIELIGTSRPIVDRRSPRPNAVHRM